MTQLTRDSLESLLSPQLTSVTSARKIAQSHSKGDIRISTITSFPLLVHVNSLTLFCFFTFKLRGSETYKACPNRDPTVGFFPLNICLFHLCGCTCVCMCVCVFFLSLSPPLFAWFIPHFATIFFWIIIISWTGKGCNSLCLLHLIIQVD